MEKKDRECVLSLQDVADAAARCPLIDGRVILDRSGSAILRSSGVPLLVVVGQVIAQDAFDDVVDGATHDLGDIDPEDVYASFTFFEELLFLIGSKSLEDVRSNVCGNEETTGKQEAKCRHN